MNTFLILMLASTSILAAEPLAKTWKAPDGTEVLYRFSSPAEPEEGKKYPLVLFLHGSGQRGTDNTAQMGNGFKAILENAAKLNEPIYLLAPQCPPGRWWSAPAEGYLALANAQGENKLLAAILALVTEKTGTHFVDADRIYVTGLSMGGFATWDLLGRSPETFAAAIPICGGGDISQVESYKHIPIRIFHGDQDQVVPTAASVIMADALKAAKGKAELTIYEGVGHDSWTQTYGNEEVIKWLLSQKK